MINDGVSALFCKLGNVYRVKTRSVPVPVEMGTSPTKGKNDIEEWKAYLTDLLSCSRETTTKDRAGLAKRIERLSAKDIGSVSVLWKTSKVRVIGSPSRKC